ncbi:MAG: hypothetical protein RLZZ08_1245 [Pseudomonadota bacterium]|jgi:outer membrane receptor protein involved in Fe transport
MQKVGSVRPLRRALWLSATAAAIVAGTSPALAQDASAASADQPIIVTGSRIARDGAEAPTPVTVLGSDLLQARAASNVADVLNELPSFRALVTPATQQAVGGNIGARVLDLRGLGGARTLVLLDGKRHVSSTQQGTVDINLIPTALISRVEVVTGGASAAYGSDAVAGVVNFILDRKLEGFRAKVQGGISQKGDAGEEFASAAWGTSFGGGRGHFMIAGEYSNSDGLGDCYSRDWCPKEMLVGNASAGAGGNPANIRTGPNQTGAINYNGLIYAGPLRGTTVNADGTLRQYQYGSIFGGATAPLFAVGGEDSLNNSFLRGILLTPPVERYTGYASAGYDLSDTVRATLDLSYGQVNGEVYGSLPRANFTIARDNAYLPPALATAMDNAEVTTVSLGRAFGDLGNPHDTSVNKTWRAVLGLEGDLGAGWKWDAYYQYGHNNFRQDYTQDAVAARLQAAVDAVSVGGSIVCRVNSDISTANDVPGCVPYNVFGAGNASAGARAWAAPSGFQTAVTEQNVAAINANGSLFDLPGGALKLAVGGEFRSDSLTGDADALSTANAFWSFNGKAINGKIQVTEGYLEANAPLLANVPFASLLELNGAVRRTHYSRSSATSDSSVSATTWKLGAVYEPAPGLRFRATRSRDIRAPNLSELFGPVSGGRTTIVDPANAGAQVQITQFTGANALLNPEVADTLTFGAVASPKVAFARRISFSADFFNIGIDGAIGTLGSQTIVNRCQAGASEFCALIRRDVSNQLIDVQNVQLNINAQKNRGVDFEFNFDSHEGSMGALGLRLLATHYFELSTTDSVGKTDRAGQTGYRPGTTTGMPSWMVDADVNWTLNKLTLGLHERYISGGIFDVLLLGPEDAGYAVTKTNTVSTNRVKSAFYTDFNLAYHVTENVEVFGVVNNLFDRDPPRAASAQGATNQVFFDPIGRYFKGGARVRF